MYQTNALLSATPGSFGSGSGRVRFFRRVEGKGEPTPPVVVRSHYNDEGIRILLEDHFAKARPYLRHRYMLNDLVKEIGVPRHVLSVSMHRLYGMGFPLLINQYRIAFLLDNLNRPDWKKYTQEAIGMECGFSSRNSFIKYVKRFLGKNPSQVMKDPKPRNLEWNVPMKVVHQALAMDSSS